MELILICGVLLLSLLAIPLFHYYLSTSSDNRRLPPGKTGWPLIGESLALLFNMKNGHLERFSLERMRKYSPHVFKTSIGGDHVAIFCGAEGNKFLFSNSNKLVKRWIPKSLRMISVDKEPEAMVDLFLRPVFSAFLKADSLRYFVGIMDTMAQHHLESSWPHGQVIEVFPSVKYYAFAVVCRFSLSIEDGDVVKRLLHLLNPITEGIQSLPINLPGTRLNRAMKAAATLRSLIQQIIRQRRNQHYSSSASHHRSFLSYLLEAHEDDEVVTDGVIGMLIAGHETSSSAISIIIKVLTDYPDIYHRVYQGMRNVENMEVGASKKFGELLDLEDTKKMKYTWNVAREVMRLYAPAPFLTREAMTDFTYGDYHVPKGYKIITNIHAIHKDPNYFPEPEKFNPNRFDGDGTLPYTYIPFGGGPYICPGMNYAQLLVIVFVHNVVKRFKWEPLIPSEKIIGVPFPKPAKGLPILLHLHAH